MDNVKTGNLIREARKRKGMTQKDLAELLHITDRAVSKWERGLCAPDISLLEPLSKILDLSILELIEGRSDPHSMRSPEVEESAIAVIQYSSTSLEQKVSRTRRTDLGLAAAILLLLVLLSSFLLLRKGTPFIIDRNLSPDGNTAITVYSKELTADGFSLRDGISLIVDLGDANGHYNLSYGDYTYHGVHWAPDSEKYVLSLKSEDGTRLILSSMVTSSDTELSKVLSFGVETTELSMYGYQMDGIFPVIEYQFLQWSLDSESMLIYYSFVDQSGLLHDGYFWYHCSNGNVTAILEMA